MTVEDLLNGKTDDLIPCRTCITDADILLKRVLTKLSQIINSANLVPKCSEEIKVILKDVENILGIFENLKRIINRDESIIVLDDEDTSDVEWIGGVTNIEEVNRVQYRTSWVQNNNDVKNYGNLDSIQPIDTADTLNDNCQSECDIEATSNIDLIENDELIAEISRMEENQHLHGLNSEKEQTKLFPLECRIELERCDTIYKTMVQHGKRSQYSDDAELLRLLDLSSLEKKSNKRSYTSSDGPTKHSAKKRPKREKVFSDASDIDIDSSDSSDNYSTDNESNCDNQNVDEFDDSYDDNSDDSEKRAKLRLLEDSDASDSSDEEVDDSEDELKCSKNKKKYKSSQKLERKSSKFNFKLPGDEFLRKKKFKDPNDLESSSCNDDAESDDSSSSEASEGKDNHSEPLSNHKNAVIVPTLKIKTRGRRNIRKVLDDQDISENTKKAAEDEESRCKREAKRTEQLECLLRSKEIDAGDKSLILDFDVDSKRVLLAVDKKLVKLLKPHQREGVKFMWDCCFESVQQIQEQEGSGCVLAHCMGLGKTLQVVTLSHTLLTNQETGIRTVMIACPKNTILNWVDEFRTWLKRSQVPSDLSHRIFEFSQEHKKPRQIEIISEWQRKGGVLIIGYEMFRSLTSGENESLEIRQLLLNPGADLVVCDEGHLLKNGKTELAKSMQCVKTKRRIILTGTPLQNNLGEYHCMIDFVKPNLLGSKKEFSNKFENPINNGKLYDSTDDDVKLMKHRAHVLHRLLEGCVQRRDYELLKSLLPSKQEYVISLRLSDLQMQMYDYYVSNVDSKVSGESSKENCFLNHYRVIKLLVAHPKSLQLYKQEKDRKKCSTNQEVEADSWWRSFVNEKENFDDISLSHKLIFLFGLLDSCAKRQEKVLVFSQCLHTLNVIEMFLKRAKVSECDDDSITALGWKAGHDYYRIDGGVSIKKRSKRCKSFNDPANKNVKLMLMSTKAGGLGINLTGANRVVVFAPSWNPSDDLQSIFRVFRFGQTKPCYVYRFVCAGTMEEKIYNRQVTKLSLSLRVLDEHQVERHYKDADLMELYTLKRLEDQRPTIERQWISACAKDELLAKLLTTHGKYVFNLFEHESLLKNQEEEKLDEQERQQAWHDYQHQKNNSETKATPVPEEQPSS